MSGTKKQPDAAASLAAMLRGAEPVPAGAKLALVLRMSVPAMMAEFASMAMSFIDAAMIGRLGTADAAAVGLMASSTWLFGGVCWAGVVGFSVQIAQAVGAGREAEARSVLRQGLAVLGGLSLALAAAGAAVSPWLPGWLGGRGGTALLAGRYFAICMAGVPFLQLGALSTAALQARGDMRTPGSLNMQMCALNVLFNLLLIFPAREWTLPSGFALRLPGAGLGVAGAALGTALAEAVTALRLGRALLVRDPVLSLRADERLRLSRRVVRKAARLSAPVAFENAAMNAAVVAATAVVAPLGDVAIAANSFAATAEGLCYLPCIGIRAAAQTIVGQAVGAARAAAARSFAFLATACGMLAMACGGVLLWFAAPHLIGLFTREPDIVREGAARRGRHAGPRRVQLPEHVVRAAAARGDPGGTPRAPRRLGGDRRRTRRPRVLRAGPAQVVRLERRRSVAVAGTSSRGEPWQAARSASSWSAATRRISARVSASVNSPPFETTRWKFAMLLLT